MILQGSIEEEPTVTPVWIFCAPVAVEPAFTEPCAEPGVALLLLTVDAEPELGPPALNPAVEDAVPRFSEPEDAEYNH